MYIGILAAAMVVAVAVGMAFTEFGAGVQVGVLAMRRVLPGYWRGAGRHITQVLLALAGGSAEPAWSAAMLPEPTPVRRRRASVPAAPPDPVALEPGSDLWGTPAAAPGPSGRAVLAGPRLGAPTFKSG